VILDLASLYGMWENLLTAVERGTQVQHSTIGDSIGEKETGAVNITSNLGSQSPLQGISEAPNPSAAAPAVSEASCGASSPSPSTAAPQVAALATAIGIGIGTGAARQPGMAMQLPLLAAEATDSKDPSLEGDSKSNVPSKSKEPKYTRKPTWNPVIDPTVNPDMSLFWRLATPLEVGMEVKAVYNARPKPVPEGCGKWCNHSYLAKITSLSPNAIPPVVSVLFLADQVEEHNVLYTSLQARFIKAGPEPAPAPAPGAKKRVPAAKKKARTVAAPAASGATEEPYDSSDAEGAHQTATAATH
jgi:hypothetical protein